MTSARTQKAAVWAGLGTFVVVLIGVVLIARFIPPPDPSQTADQVAETYRTHQDRIRAGTFVMFLSAGMLNFFVASISHQLKRIPGPVAAVMSQTQLIGGALGTFMFLWAPMIWIAATFRPNERSVETLATLHDLAFLAWLGNASWVIAQGIAIAVAIFSDRSQRPVYPRWVAYLNIWVVLLYLPTALDIFFTSGVFAWDGLIVFWVPTVVFGLWMIAMTIATARAIDDEHAERRPAMHAGLVNV
jgi:hypothetical protein